MEDQKTGDAATIVDSVLTGKKSSRRPDMQDKPDTKISDSSSRPDRKYTHTMETKTGIAAFGNWIVDNIAMVDRARPLIDTEKLKRYLNDGGPIEDISISVISGDYGPINHLLVYPTNIEGELLSISSISGGTGGAPYNVLIDLVKLDENIPLAAVGIVGQDADGKSIILDLAKHGIDYTGMIMSPEARTSFTYVIQPAGGNRSFFHFSADTNDKLSFEHIEQNMRLIQTHKICHAGYALLLHELDAKDDEYGTKMARTLRMIQDSGVKTSLAVVSHSDTSKFEEIVVPSLQYTDYFMPNEYEATNTAGIEVKDKDSASDAAKKMFDEFGVKDTVVIHMGEKGSFGMKADGTKHYQPSHDVKNIRVTAGAGDAMEAGMLYALHQGLDLVSGMRLGTAMAAICLGGESCTDAMRDLAFTEKYMQSTRYRK